MIEIAYPLGLLSLLAVPILIALHLLRPRRRRVVLPSTTLWEAALKDREPRLGFRSLLRNLSLLLLLASALVLGLALAGPHWLTRASAGADTVLVLDVSASMKTRSGIGKTRFDLALSEALEIVDGLPRGGRMLVMTSGRKAVLRTGFEADRDALRRVLGELRPGDEAGRPREALALALSLLRGRGESHITFLTDGAFDRDVDPGSPQVGFRVVGEPARNVAITRFEFRQELANEDRFQMLMTVRNYTDAPVVVPASVRLDDRVLLRRSVTLAAHAEETVVLPFTGRARGQAIARLDLDDDLAADNLAYAAVHADEPLRVLLFTRGNFYLESALEALPNLVLVKRNGSPAEDIARLARDYDAIVLDGVAAPRLPAGNFLLVNTVAPGLPFSDSGQLVRPGTLVRGQSALMRDADLSALRVDQARRVVTGKQAPGLQRLFWSPETDLALALLDGDVKLVYLGFDLARSNFPLQAAFPLFCSRSLEWLRPRGDGFVPTHAAAGSTWTIVLPPGETRVTLRTPSGKSKTLESEGGSALFDATADAGIYRYTIGEVARYFAVSLTDARESDVNNRFAPSERRTEARPAGKGAQALAPLWPPLLLLALILLALEWCVWTGSRIRA